LGRCLFQQDVMLQLNRNKCEHRTEFNWKEERSVLSEPLVSGVRLAGSLLH